MGLVILELLALKCQKKILIEKMSIQDNTFSFDWLFIKLADNKAMHKVLEVFEIQEDLTALELPALEC